MSLDGGRGGEGRGGEGRGGKGRGGEGRGGEGRGREGSREDSSIIKCSAISVQTPKQENALLSIYALLHANRVFF